MAESHKKRLGSADPSGLQPLALSAHNLLLLALHSLWKNPTGQELAYTFHTPRRTISFYQTRLWPILDQCLQEFVSPPVVRNLPRFDTGPLKGAFIMIDSTPTPIRQPINHADRKLYYNYKKKPTRYAMKTQIAVGLDLRIWDVSSTYPFSVHDKTVFQESKIPHWLSDRKLALGDLGYKSLPNVIVPHKKPRGRELTSSEKLFNYQLAHVRVAIENIFKRVKDYRIISEIYRRDYHKLEQFNCIFKVVCELVNIHTQTHPVRRQLSSMRKLPMVLQPPRLSSLTKPP